MTSPESESWRPVPGWEGRYEASDAGRARSVDHTTPDATSRSGVRRFKGRILTPAYSEGYPAFHFRRPGKSLQIRAHRLVLLTFVGPCPPGMQALHRKNDRWDCRLQNVYYGTPAQNSQDAITDGTNQHTRRSHCDRKHRLGAPNARPQHTAKGWRPCLACHRARDAWRYFRLKEFVDQEAWVQAKSDEYYASILAAAAVAGRPADI